MNINITYTITAIIALTSLASPIITTIINNKHDLEIKKLEHNSNIKQEVLKNFALSINSLFNEQYFDAEFHKDLNLLYIYFDVDETLLNAIIVTKYTDWRVFQKDVALLMKSLSKQIKSK